MRKKIKIKALVAGDAGGANKIIKKIKITDKGYIKIEIKTKKEIKIKDKGNVRWCRWCEED